jgi:hypothetical protein
VEVGDPLSQRTIVALWNCVAETESVRDTEGLINTVNVPVWVTVSVELNDAERLSVGDAVKVDDTLPQGELDAVRVEDADAVRVATWTDGDADEDEMLLWLLITVDEGRGETENEEVPVIVDICVSEPVGLDEGLDRALKVSATKEAEEFAVSEENALIDAIEVAVDDAEISDDIVWVAQLVNEPDAVSEGLVLGVADDDSELVPHDVRESRGENVLEAESVGPTGLPVAIPDNELDPDEVGDELALEDERNEGVTEGE